MNILDKLEMDLHYAKKVGRNSPHFNLIARCETLIDVIREKDEKLKRILEISLRDSKIEKLTKEAIALTDTLDHSS